MNFRTALFAAVCSVLLGIATADDDENATNTTAPTSAPTNYGGLPATYTTATILSGATCVPLENVWYFKAGNFILIGSESLGLLGENAFVKKVYENSLCGKVLGSRRLWNQQAGSIELTVGTQNAYKKGTKVQVVPPPNYGSTCFPGDAMVDVYGRGATNMASLSVGDRVLVENGEFEPVLSFLHKVQGVAQALTLVHSQGTLQASENHIVFTSRGDMPASALRPGDELLMESGPSAILAIGEGITATGMYAPFTASGALVVDGVAVSNYGTPTSKSSLPHAAAHAAFFSLRVYYLLDLAMAAKVLCSLAVVMMLPHKF